jgi:hypothetical protein
LIKLGVVYSLDKNNKEHLKQSISSFLQAL